MKQPIKSYHLDDEQHWVAELECGHNQHVRHNPPLVSRPWTQTQAGRDSMLGFELDCKKCDDDEPSDQIESDDLAITTECDLETSVADWAIEYPKTIGLFEELGIDYCCGGKSLRFACQKQSLVPVEILEKIKQALNAPGRTQ